jgi:predicted Zn-ribbon and HTH transcriptional regulator
MDLIHQKCRTKHLEETARGQLRDLKMDHQSYLKFYASYSALFEQTGLHDNNESGSTFAWALNAHYLEYLLDNNQFIRLQQKEKLSIVGIHAILSTKVANEQEVIRALRRRSKRTNLKVKNIDIQKITCHRCGKQGPTRGAVSFPKQQLKLKLNKLIFQPWNRTKTQTLTGTNSANHLTLL